MSNQQAPSYFDERKVETQILTQVQGDYISKTDFINIISPLVSYIEKLSKTYSVLENDGHNEIEYMYSKPDILTILGLIPNN